MVKGGYKGNRVLWEDHGAGSQGHEEESQKGHLAS